jgi:hypothetical protein
MATTVEKLTAHVDDLKQGKIDVNTASRLISLLRQITEEDNSKADLSDDHAICRLGCAHETRSKKCARDIDRDRGSPSKRSSAARSF